MSKSKNGNNISIAIPTFIAGTILVIALAGFAGYTVGNRSPKTRVFPAPTASQDAKGCTEEAKICPDGSAVGRTGPSCEFAPCPTTDNTITPTPQDMGDDSVFCTMDAKLCSDGSYVGRIPPSCDFAACPGE